MFLSFYSNKEDIKRKGKKVNERGMMVIIIWVLCSIKALGIVNKFENLVDLFLILRVCTSLSF